MALDIKKFLMDDLGMDEASATETAAKIKPEGIARVEKSVGLLAANEAAAAQIATTQAELQVTNDRLVAEMAEWGNLSKTEQAAATELRASLEAARVRATQLETRLTTLATQHGVDPKPLLEGTAVVPEVKKPVEVPADDRRFADLGQALAFNLDLPAALQYIADEHRELTGQRLDTREITALVKKNAAVKGATINPVEIWEEKFKIPELRQAKAQKAVDDRVAAADMTGYERGRSEAALPTSTTPGRHAPVFGRRDTAGHIQPRTSALQRPQPGTSVQRAVAALATGKYRQQPAAR